MNQSIYERITQAAGGLTQLAQALGEAPNAVANWKQRGVPANRCKAVERLTGIHVSELRPQDWRDYWPEEADQREPA